MFVRTISVTPTYIHVGPCNWVQSCKLLRKYKDKQSHFIKVNFTNENLEKDFYYGFFNELKLGNIFQFMNNGLRFLDQTYNFFGYSNSQIKNHSTWFLLSSYDEDFTPGRLLETCGEVDNHDPILKQYSRYGQHFSTCRSAGKVKKIELIEDIYSSKFQKVYKIPASDGCGYISQELLDSIMAKINKSSNYSALQIRIGGAKGMVVVNPDLPGEIL